MPLIMWPSIFYDHSLYQGMLEWLDNPAVLIDPPGHGQSNGCPANPDLDTCAAAVEAILSELDIPQAVMIGVSWGGLVATRLATKDGDSRVKGIVLANTPFEKTEPAPFNTRLTVWMTRFFPERRFFRVGVAKRFFSAETPIRHPEVVRAFLQQTATFGHEDLHRVTRAVLLERPDLRAELDRVTVPALVIAGEDDKLCTPDRLRENAARIPRHRFESIPKAGHIALAERPRESALRIRDWLTDVFPFAA